MEQKLLALIKACKEYLDKTSVDEIMHFYNHDEYEMALEGLVIEMMQSVTYPSRHIIETINMLVFHYRLNVESVFDCSFWNNYKNWISIYLRK